MKRIAWTILILALLPITIITYPIWGIAYYRSVIN